MCAVLTFVATTSAMSQVDADSRATCFLEEGGCFAAAVYGLAPIVVVSMVLVGGRVHG